MTGFLEFKEKLKAFFSKYDRILIGILKFAATFLMLQVFYNHTDALPEISYATVIFLVAALVCAIFPQGMMNVVVCILLLYRMYQVGMETALVMGLALLIMICLYFVFKPQNSCLMSLSAIATTFKVPGLLVIPVGMMFEPFSVVLMAFGMILGNYVEFVNTNLSVLTGSTETMTMVQKVVFLTNGLVKNNTMWLTIIAAAVTIAMVYAIRRLSVNYSWLIASISGAVVNIIVVLFGGYMMGISNDVVRTVVATVIGMAVMLLLHYFVFTLDYSRVEKVQFEDDDYIYYVKAVPKMTVSKAQPKVKTIVKRNEHVDTDQEEKKENVPAPERTQDTGVISVPIPVATADENQHQEANPDGSDMEAIKIERVAEERFAQPDGDAESGHRPKE